MNNNERTDKEIEKFLEHLVTALALTGDLFDGKAEEGMRWFQTPNDFFFGLSPFEACFCGNGEAVIVWLQDKAPQK